MGDPGWPCQVSSTFCPDWRPWHWHKLSTFHNWTLRCLIFFTCLWKSKSWLFLPIVLSGTECLSRSRACSTQCALCVSVISLPLKVREKCTLGMARPPRHPISYLQLVTASPPCLISYRTHAVKTRWHELCYELDKFSSTHLVPRSGLPHLHCYLLLH